MKEYNFNEIENKWQEIWKDTNLYKLEQDKASEPYYLLTMFPYPSGDLHIGHAYNYMPADTLARFNRMKGKDVLFPIGFDSFGLPAENAAIKHNSSPDKWTKSNIQSMTEQFTGLGLSFDMSKVIETSDVSYYMWTQWLFLQFYKNGAAYRDESIVNWDPVDKTVLANEQVINGKADRSGATVEKKKLTQWFLKITDFADDLLLGLDDLNWSSNVKAMQQNWIGKSTGVDLSFDVVNMESSIKVFTTRVDTIMGATFLALAPEHDQVKELITDAQLEDVEHFISSTAAKTNVDRLENSDSKGVFTGSYAIHPISKEEIPIYLAEYVLVDYGYGAVMAVPAHDQRDYDFANKYELGITQVIEGDEIPFTTDGVLVNSGKFDGLDKQLATKAIVEYLSGGAKEVINYRLKDWLISRQRYWGCPIPIIYCPDCGTVPVPEKDLPIVLPLDQTFSKDNRSPLEDHPDFKAAVCPECGNTGAKRETDTMDTFVDSSWYFLRFIDPEHNDSAFNREAVNKWMPVDHYIGGIEHAILHLLYARYFCYFLNSIGLINFKEPFTKLTNLGMILNEGAKMSKSKGNVVDPSYIISSHGSDVLRIYLMFLGPYTQGGEWDDNKIEGITRFIKKLWKNIGGYYSEDIVSDTSETELKIKLNQTIIKVTKDLENSSFNTAVAALMELNNILSKKIAARDISEAVLSEVLDKFLLIIAPIAPHLAEELYSITNEHGSIHNMSWPVADEQFIESGIITIAMQVNGKFKANLLTPNNSSKEDVEKLAFEYIKENNIDLGSGIKKTIFVDNKIINFVV